MRNLFGGFPAGIGSGGAPLQEPHLSPGLHREVAQSELRVSRMPIHSNQAQPNRPEKADQEGT